MIVAKELFHPDANIYLEYLGRRFVASTFCKTDTRDIERLKRHTYLSSVSFLFYKDTLLIKTDKYSFQFYNAKRINDDIDLLEYLIA